MLKFIPLFLILNYGVTLESTHSRAKRWIWDDIWNMGSNTNEFKDVGCGTHPINLNLTYRIQTPFHQYQIPYPAGFDCTWKFLGSSCSPVISCNSFQLSDSPDCSNANLEITDDFTVSKKFCGNSGPINATTGTAILIAKFPRSLSVPTRGFSCLVSCPASVEGLNIINTTLSTPAVANCSCGVTGTTGGDQVQGHRVVGGKDAAPGYWKWQVALVPKTRKNPFCGGALINDRFVLSAAHCVVTTGLLAIPAAADVILNAYNLKNSSELIIRRGVVGIYPHPFYDPISQDYDYSLIEFNEPVNLAAFGEPSVRTVCLPPRGSRDTFVGQNATVTGWGVTKEGGEQPTNLQQADIPVISNTDCSQQYGTENRRIRITDRMLCASYPEGGIDSCQGDSGGPFVLKREDGRFMEIGVVSFGEGCARRGKPGVYARTTEVNDWIRSVAKRGTWCSE